LTFATRHADVLLCFVNDGSSDATISVLNAFQMQSPPNTCILDLRNNVGKAEAVRLGMLHVHNNYNIPLIGFLDADLATDPEEWLDMAKFQFDHDKYSAIVGSRIQRLGANISRDNRRSIFSMIFRNLIKLILKEKFQDTQCGAKVFKRELIPYLFGKKYISSWLFDIEIFIRIQHKFGRNALRKGVLEYPLLEWKEVGNSRLKISHAFMMPFYLYLIFIKYRRSEIH
jgi:glycosyltransferase involved in cell wall biosynthesis